MIETFKSYWKRAGERQNSHRGRRPDTVYTIFHNANAMKLSFHKPPNERGEIVIAWKDTVRVQAFKRDLYAVDLICLAILLKNNRTVEISEEMEGWQSLVEKLPEYLPECRDFGEWFEAVAFPAFKPNFSDIYLRNETTQ